MENHGTHFISQTFQRFPKVPKEQADVGHVLVLEYGQKMARFQPALLTGGGAESLGPPILGGDL